MDILSGDSDQLVRFLLAIGVILILLYLLNFVLRKLNRLSYRTTRKGQEPRLTVREAVQVDHKRSLVLVRRDHVEHLLLIGGENDLLVEHHIMPHMPPQHQGQPPAGMARQMPAPPKPPAQTASNQTAANQTASLKRPQAHPAPVTTGAKQAAARTTTAAAVTTAASLAAGQTRLCAQPDRRTGQGDGAQGRRSRPHRTERLSTATCPNPRKRGKGWRRTRAKTRGKGL